MSLAQIGEFAFVLLSRASSVHLIEVIFLFFKLDFWFCTDNGSTVVVQCSLVS
jgi:hypothetical protein